LDTEGKGRQDYETPWEFIDFVNKRWPIFFDLAAHKDNHKVPAYFNEQDNALQQDWKVALDDRWGWLNPPFGNTSQWMRKCAEECNKGTKIVTLTLANIGTNWYNDYVKPNALSFVLRDRLTFEGQQHVYPKDLMLSIWEKGIVGFGFCNWKGDKK